MLCRDCLQAQAEVGDKVQASSAKREVNQRLSDKRLFPLISEGKIVQLVTDEAKNGTLESLHLALTKADNGISQSLSSHLGEGGPLQEALSQDTRCKVSPPLC